MAVHNNSGPKMWLRACGKGAKSVTHRKNKVLLKSMGLRGHAGFVIVKQH